MIVIDTHVLIWWLTDASQLSAKARRTLTVEAKQEGIVASAISVLEIATAARRGRLHLAMPVDAWLADTRSLPELRYEPVSGEIAQMAGSFGDEMHGDPADRIIAATAIVLNAPLVTADAKLRTVKTVKTIW